MYTNGRHIPLLPPRILQWPWCEFDCKKRFASGLNLRIVIKAREPWGGLWRGSPDVQEVSPCRCGKVCPRFKRRISTVIQSSYSSLSHSRTRFQTILAEVVLEALDFVKWGHPCIECQIWSNCEWSSSHFKSLRSSFGEGWGWMVLQFLQKAAAVLLKPSGTKRRDVPCSYTDSMFPFDRLWFLWSFRFFEVRVLRTQCGLNAMSRNLFWRTKITLALSFYAITHLNISYALRHCHGMQVKACPFQNTTLLKFWGWIKALQVSYDAPSKWRREQADHYSPSSIPGISNFFIMTFVFIIVLMARLQPPPRLFLTVWTGWSFSTDGEIHQNLMKP